MTRIAQHLTFWTLILAVFVIPVGMVASDMANHECHFSCARQ